MKQERMVGNTKLIWNTENATPEVIARSEQEIAEQVSANFYEKLLKESTA